MNWLKRLAAWWDRQYHKARGCDGKPYHNGMCECECRTHYLGL
jgi:hypothetical protein